MQVAFMAVYYFFIVLTTSTNHRMPKQRTDIEPCFLVPPRIVSAYPNSVRLRAYSYLFGMAGVVVAIMMFDIILRLPIFGGLSVASLHWHVASLGVANQAIILPCLYSPLADAVETVSVLKTPPLPTMTTLITNLLNQQSFYIMQRRLHPALIPERTQLVPAGERWSWRKITIVRVWLRCLGFLSIERAEEIPELACGVLVIFFTEYLYNEDFF